jgi:hypothetical protein
VSVASEIAAAVAFTGYPVHQISYDGTATTYFVMNMDGIPDNFADDAPQHDRWLVQLHLFAPFTLNTTTIRRQIRNALHAAGYTYPSQVDASENARAADGTEQHIVFEFEATEAIADV